MQHSDYNFIATYAKAKNYKIIIITTLQVSKRAKKNFPNENFNFSFMKIENSQRHICSNEAIDEDLRCGNRQKPLEKGENFMLPPNVAQC